MSSGIQTREEDSMALLLGRLEDFDKSKEDWTQYAELAVAEMMPFQFVVLLLIPYD